MITGLFLFTARAGDPVPAPPHRLPLPIPRSIPSSAAIPAALPTAQLNTQKGIVIIVFSPLLRHYFAVFSFMGLTYFSFFNILVMGLFPPSRRFASLASGGFPFYKGKLRRPASPETGSYCPSQDPAAQPPMHLLRSSHLCAFSSFLLNNFQTLGQVLFIGHAVGYT